MLKPFVERGDPSTVRMEPGYYQSRSHLCQLPPEIIIHITTLAATLEAMRPMGLPELMFDASTRPWFSPVRDIATLVLHTSICRYFRDLCLGTPSLWNYISSEFHPEIVNLVLERSGSSPLHAEVTDAESFKSKRTLKTLSDFPNSYESRAERYLSNTDIILKSCPRIRFLTISSSLLSEFRGLARPSPEFLQVLTDAFKSCSNSGTSMLEGIAVDSFYPSRVSYCVLQENLVDTLLSLAVPKKALLRRLYLRLTFTPWHFLRTTSQSLTYLSMTIVSPMDSLINGLGSVLKKHSTLEWLALDIQRLIGESASAPANTAYCPSREKIELPVLTKLLLTGDDDSSSSVLDMLKLPSLSNICIVDDSSNLLASERMTQTLLQIAKLDFPFADRLHVSFEGPYARFDLKTSKKGTGSPHEPDDEDIVFTYTYARRLVTTTMQLSSTVLLRQLTVLELTSIKHINIPIFPDPEPSFAGKLVRLVPNVESINVYYGHLSFHAGEDCMTDMLRPAQLLWEDDIHDSSRQFETTGDEVGTRHLPLLQQVNFTGIRFDKERDGEFLSELSDTLARRCEAGYQRTMVQFVGCLGMGDLGENDSLVDSVVVSLGNLHVGPGL